ncbi:hypothetical protein AALO_G00039160 [Alosa alosa]|uniref:Uncharacterized protein n=1 Tax=Alosa alosa TaxID=278164 RepID=A0AAV6HBH3_9TELE|nr:hypothetical protein AALO_G00039160 [Alosa alosa]
MKQGMTSGSQMAKMDEELKRDLKRQRTTLLESDSDETCCDLFDPPKKRKSVVVEDGIPQESQRPGAVPAVFVEMDEETGSERAARTGVITESSHKQNGRFIYFLQPK